VFDVLLPLRVLFRSASPRQLAEAIAAESAEPADAEARAQAFLAATPTGQPEGGACGTSTG